MRRLALVVGIVAALVVVPGAEAVGPGAPGAGNIAYWRLGEGPGATAAPDSSGNGNHGVCGVVVASTPSSAHFAGCPTFGVPAREGWGSSFDGNDDFVSVANTIAGTFTATAWIKTTQLVGPPGGRAWTGSAILHTDVGGAGPDMVPMGHVNGKLVFGTGECPSSSYDDLTSASSINTGQWVHVAVSRNQLSGAKRLYVNGILEAAGTGGTCSYNANPKLNIGANPYDARFFNGVIDDVHLFNRVLTGPEIATMASTGATWTTKTWLSAAGTAVQPAALTVPAPAVTATVPAASNSVTVSWSSVTVGSTAATYTVQRYDAGNVQQAITGTCVGTVSTTTCNEPNVPAGQWRYLVRPSALGWTAPQSGQSDFVTTSGLER